MELNNFEKHLQNSLRNMEEEVDVSSILATLPIKTAKRKRFGFFFIGTFAALMLTASTIYFLNSENSNTDSLSSIQIQQRTANESLASLPSISSDAHTTDDSEIISTELDQNKSIVDRIQNTINYSKNTSKTNISDSDQLINNDFKTSFTISSINGTIDNNSSTVRMNNSPFEAHGNGYEVLDKNRFKFTNYEIGNRAENQIIEQYTNKLSSIDIKMFDNSSHLYASKLEPNYVNCPKFDSNPWIFEFGTVMGLSKPNKTLTRKTQDIIPAYTSRANNEKSLEGLDLELFLSAKRARWPVFVKSGINYSRWSERIRIEEDYTEIDTIQGIISITTSQSGDTIKYIYGDIYIERDVEIRKDIHYYLNRIDIPFSLVYEKEYGNHAFQIEGGTRVNVSTFARGLIYNNNANFSLASKPDFFRRITGLSYFGKLHYRYYLTKNHFIGAQGYYQYLPADMSSEGNMISQKYTNFGFGAQYGYRF